ncbi:hypothetical protein BZARG_2191 [Bizionia argentinensis JUB59]|uniref:TonB C-terminal domain-containing protein n=1 Tax=Bizionia argentinensis JUB59 TaxID=1046627 RepID=G2EAJ8_9FLAO|nr:hypothetical protein [Bizionia argentinensis]EGV44546.1 hypothetical protein BZARG_2191 [Bizionia argentinensis JUB59]
MKKLYVILIFLTISSCNYFDAKKTSSDVILENELRTFNWNEVDEYPMFATCYENASKEEKKQCFQNTLTHIITTKLQRHTLIVSQDISDTIFIKFKISKEGNLSLIDIEADSLTIKEIPNIKELLHESVDSLPEIFPAIRRSQQVNTAFTLPVIIQVD